MYLLYECVSVLCTLFDCRNQAMLDESRGLSERSEEEGKGEEALVSLSRLIDTSALCIQETMGLERTFHLYRSMDLSQIVVINSTHRAVGVITSSNLATVKTRLPTPTSTWS